MRIGRGVTRVKVLTGALLGPLACAAVAYAHGNRADLAFYGDFGATAAHCQRVIARAAVRCVTTVVGARQACMEATFSGQTCDEAAVDTETQAARRDATNDIATACTEQEAQLLQFNNVAEAQTDATNTCSEMETAALSAAFGPAFATGSVGATDGMPAACMRATADGVGRLLRLAAGARRQALDHIATRPLPVSQKLALMTRSDRRIARARTLVQQRIEASCPDASFTAIYRRNIDEFLDAVQGRAACVTSATYVQSAVSCPTPVCGNGVQEPGEACDDGNQYNADGCHNDCTKNDCELFPSTFDLIQRAVFENHGCTNDLCHGSSQQGGLDLRSGKSYANLVDAPSMASILKRVEPGIEEQSLLYLKLAAATLMRSGVPGSPMPQGLPPLSEGELEAVRLWIYSGAPHTGVVRGTADLLNACLPPPEPLQIRPPAAPAPGTGVQLHMVPWVVPAKSESEVCFAAYYDVTDQVPAEFRGEDGRTFRFNQQLATQDPLSHHLVPQFYKGEYPPDDPSWGPYTCRGGANDGQACNPLDVGVCGPQSDCTTTPVKSVACIGFGPADQLVNLKMLGFAGAQETVAQQAYPPGVYAEIPLKGIILWNSHAFNLADQAGKVEAWLNYYFAPPADQLHPVQDILNVDDVFAMHVPAFEKEDVCNIDIVPDGGEVFQLSSHMHKRGKRFDIFRGAFRCSGGTNAGQACSPQWPDMCPDASCLEQNGRDPAQGLMYTSLIYNDPVTLHFDPPLPFTGTDVDRSLTYCAVYDNGFTNPAEVKRQSTSPTTPLPVPGFGGPCAQPTNCVAGQVRALCTGRTAAERNASCDSSPGAGDGVCDACPLTGGVTTEDEMFVLLGSYFFE